jgi:hypothetical protein
MMSVKLVEPTSNLSSLDNRQAAAKIRAQDENTTHRYSAFVKPSFFRSAYQPTDDDRHLILQCICSWLKALCQHLREVGRSNPPTSPDHLREQLANELNFTQYTKQMFRAEAAEHFNFRKHLEDQHWPSNVEVPNANFARKHRLVVSTLLVYSSQFPAVSRTKGRHSLANFCC